MMWIFPLKMPVYTSHLHTTEEYVESHTRPPPSSRADRRKNRHPPSFRRPRRSVTTGKCTN